MLFFPFTFIYLELYIKTSHPIYQFDRINLNRFLFTKNYFLSNITLVSKSLSIQFQYNQQIVEPFILYYLIISMSRLFIFFYEQVALKVKDLKDK